MTADVSNGALAGYPSGVSGNFAPVSTGSDVTRVACAGSGRMSDAPRTRSEPSVGA